MYCYSSFLHKQLQKCTESLIIDVQYHCYPLFFQVYLLGGALCVLAGVLCLASVRWSAVATISTFKYPSVTAGKKREVGSSIYVGWASSMLLLLGGAVMCCVSGERNPSSYSNAVSSTDTQSLLIYVIEPDVRLFDAAAILPERNSLNIHHTELWGIMPFYI